MNDNTEDINIENRLAPCGRKVVLNRRCMCGQGEVPVIYTIVSVEWGTEGEFYQLSDGNENHPNVELPRAEVLRLLGWIE